MYIQSQAGLRVTIPSYRMNVRPEPIKDVILSLPESVVSFYILPGFLRTGYPILQNDYPAKEHERHTIISSAVSTYILSGFLRLTISSYRTTIPLEKIKDGILSLWPRFLTNDYPASQNTYPARGDKRRDVVA